MLLACAGEITDPGAPLGPGGGGNTPGAVAPPAGFVPVESALRRLTVAQYQNSLRDLLGEGITLPDDLEPDTVINGFTSIGAARISLSSRATEQFETTALAVARQALTDPARRAALVTCTPAGNVDDACARQFVTEFGRRAWRRPLTAEEITRWATVGTNASQTLGNFWGGLEYALAGLLQSPHFLYRQELGAADPRNPARLVFNDWELATRLSYFLWNSTPDSELLDAAAAGLLSKGTGLATQAERLLASPRAREAVQVFFGDLLHLTELDELQQSTTTFPQVTATLGVSMRSETLQVLDDLIFGQDADYREIFDTRTTFVNGELAKLYGVTAPSGTAFAKTTLPDTGVRAGLLGQGSFLALNAHATTTSPTLRGKFIREVLLCQAIPPPPPDVVTTLPEDPDSGTPRTMRQKLQVHREVASCAACHQVMDPLGLALENFDAIGAYRTTDAGQTIDPSGDLDGARFSGPRELATLLKQHPDVASCIARSLYRHATGHVEAGGEEPAVTTLATELQANGYRFRSLMLGVVRSAGFVYAAPLR
jgi:hypothetical protein